MCIHYFGIFTGTNLSIDVKSLTLVLVIVCKKMCAILLPTISEGGIDFTIPQPARLGFASTLGLRDGKINATLTYGW